MPRSRAEVFQEADSITHLAESALTRRDRAQPRLRNIADHLVKQSQDAQPLQHEALISDEVAARCLAHFKLLLLAQIFGSHKLNIPHIGDTKIADLRADQSLAATALYHNSEYLERVRENIGFDPRLIPVQTRTFNRYKLPGTDVVIKSLLTGVRQPGFRPVDRRVPRQIEEVAADRDIDYFVSSALGQGNQPFYFPDSLRSFAESPLPQGVEQFGNACFRSSTKADAAIINAQPRVGHFAAIAGAGFGQLCELNEKGELARHANIFLGPGNVLGAEKSVLQCTLEAGKFNLERCFLIVEHQEGDSYVMDFPTSEQTASGNVPKHLERNAAWIQRAEARYGAEGLKAIVPGDLSCQLPRQGKPIFRLAEMIRRDARYCGIPEANIIVNNVCPTMGNGKPENMLRHWSNTFETSLFPGVFVAPGTPLPADNLLLWPRNGYFVWQE